MSDLLETLLDNARNEAIRLQHPYIRSEHLLLALIQMNAESLPISYEQLFARIADLPTPSCGAEQKLSLAQGAKRALQSIQASADISTQTIAAHILQSSPMLRHILHDIGEASDAQSD